MNALYANEAMAVTMS